MAGAAPAYRYDSYRQSAAPRPQRQPNVRVVPGRRPAETVSPAVVAAVKIFVVVMAVFAIVACVRIGLAAATVNTMLQTESISQQVDNLKSGSANLEVRESTLSSPTNVKNVASTQLGMSQATEVDTLVLSPDVVCYDSAGNLSLSKSLAVAAQG